MSDEIKYVMRRVAALLADVFPFIELRWDKDETYGFYGRIGKIYTVRVSAADENDNGHVVNISISSLNNDLNSNLRLTVDPNWDLVESWIMENVYREVVMEASRMLDTCGIEFSAPPLSVKHGPHQEHYFSRPENHANHLIDMSEIYWRGAALIGGPGGEANTTVALHIAYSMMEELSVCYINNEKETDEILSLMEDLFPIDRKLNIRRFCPEGDVDDICSWFVEWAHDLPVTHLIIIDDPEITDKLMKRLPELASLTKIDILGITHPPKKVDNPNKWEKKLGDLLYELGGAFWVEWGEKKEVGQLYVVKHPMQQGAKLLPVDIQR